MSLELRQHMKLAQKLLMTQQLRQAIKLLQLNRLELVGALHAEMEQNPLLEEGEAAESDLPLLEEIKASDEVPITSRVMGDDPAAVAEVNWEDYANNFDADFSFARETPAADAPSYFDFVSAKPGLLSVLAWQLTHLHLSERDMDIARFILGNLDGHGFLDADLADICQYIGCTQEEAEGVLRLVQSLDPPGVAARNVQESLLLQLERQGLEDKLPYRMVAHFFTELENHNFAEIARKLGCTVREAQKAAGLLAGLVPYPGNEYSNEPIHEIVPDVYVFNINGELVVRLNSEDLPQLQLSAEYHEAMIKQLPPDSKEYLQEKKRNALLLLSALQYRKNTISKVMESIIRHQREFFDKGPGFLRPLVLSDVAKDVGIHESTVSRATSNKYAETPQGLYELKYFFSTAAAEGENGDELTSASIKQRLGQLVRQENPAKPLSDSKLAELLEQEGIKLARRTVAKYREQMKILPVKHRRSKG